MTVILIDDKLDKLRHEFEEERRAAALNMEELEERIADLELRLEGAAQ